MKEFLTPLDKALFEVDEQRFGKCVEPYITEFPNYADADIALIGVSNNTESNSASIKIRKAFYQLMANSFSYQIVDLGDIQHGASKKDTEIALKEVCRSVLAESTIPLVLTDDHDLAYGQFQAFEKIARNIECSMVASGIDLSDSSALSKICLHEPNFLFNINALGYQSHYVTPKQVNTLQNMYFTSIRLGLLRQNIQEVEPILRNTDLMVVDLNAVKHADAPGVLTANPNGLTSDEACQLAWYSGISEKVRSFGVYGLQCDKDVRSITAKLAGQMVWYFVDGFYNRKGDHPDLHNDFTKYRCTMMNNEPDVVFYKSKRTERWWLEIPGTAKTLTIPCSYNDYVTATKGEMPDVFFRALQKALK